MERRHWVMITSLVGLVISLWIVTALQTTSVTRQSGLMNEAFEHAEQDLGLDDSLQQSLTGPARAMRIAKAARAQAEAKQQEMQQMIKLYEQDMYEMGAGSGHDSSYSMEYTPTTPSGEIDWQKKLEAEHGLTSSR